MKKLVILAVVVAAVILAGCNPCKRLARKCPSHDSTFVLVETIRDTLWLESPADSLAMAIPIETLIDLSDLGLVFEVLINSFNIGKFLLVSPTLQSGVGFRPKSRQMANTIKNEVQ